MKRLSPILTILVALVTGLAVAAGTPAGEEIKNQASVNYLDSGGTSQTTNSNQVITVVRQVYGVSVTPDGTAVAPGQFQDATPGSTVYYPYTLTNTGNGNDSFTLASTIGTDTTGGVTAPVFYLDTNGDGVVQVGEPQITEVLDLAADDDVNLIMSYQIPTGAATSSNVIATPVATSQGDAGAVDNANYHETTVVQDAVILATKAASVSQVLPNDTIVYTITATNTGTLDASNVVISDAAPAGTTLVSASTVPTGNEATAAPNATGTFATVAPGQTVRLIMTVTVDSNTVPGDIDNTATVNYDNSGGAATPVVTNTTTTTVQATYAAAVGPRNDPTDDDGVDAPYNTVEGYAVTTVDGNDEQVVATANAGDTVSFINTVRNLGTGGDTLNLTLDTSALNLPAGASVVLTRLDGTPLGSSDGDGVPDSGPLAAGADFSFVVKVLLPQGYDDQDGATTLHRVTVTATSTADPGQTDTTVNTISDVIGPGVDFGNNSGAVDNDGAVDSAVAVDETVNPGASAVFPMDVVNTGSNSDSYDLSGTVDFTDVGGNTVTVAVAYYPASADTSGDGTLSAAEIAAATPISNTGSLAPGEEGTVFAVVVTPANAAPQTVTVSQTVTSPLSGTSDSFNLNTVTVNAVKTFSFSPDRNGTAPSPGTTIYQHSATNTGNIAITDLDLSEAATGNVAGWSYLYSYDGTTYYAAASFPAPATAIAPGGTRTIYVKVNVPAGAPQGAANVLTVTAAPTFQGDGAPTGSASVTDTTIVVGGEINVVKSWSLDGGTTWFKGDGTDTGPVPQVAPGEDILYRMVLSNIGTADLTAIEVFDSVPVFTDFVIGSPVGTATCSTDDGVTFGACPTGSGIDTSVTTLKFGVATLAPGASVEVRFAVRVQ